MTENITTSEDAIELAARVYTTWAHETPSSFDSDLECGRHLARAFAAAGLLADPIHTDDGSTLPTHVQHLVSQDIGKVLAWHSEGYTADFGAGPEYVKALDVRPLEES